MKLLFDFFPIVLFFVTYKLFEDPREGILAATAVIIVSTVVQVSVSWLRDRRIEPLHLFTLGIVLVLGGVTLLLQDEIYVKWKPTAVNWLFAVAFAGSEIVGSRNLTRRMLESKVHLPGPVWTRLNLIWAGFFGVLGGLNLWVVYNFDTDTWVNFKLFGLMGLTLLFVVAQGMYLVRHMPPEDDAEGQS